MSHAPRNPPFSSSFLSLLKTSPFYYIYIYIFSMDNSEEKWLSLALENEIGTYARQETKDFCWKREIVVGWHGGSYVFPIFLYLNVFFILLLVTIWWYHTIETTPTISLKVGLSFLLILLFFFHSILSITKMPLNYFKSHFFYSFSN